MYTHRNIVVGFVIYRPGNNFLERLARTVADGFKVYIFDNSPEESNVRDFCLTRNEIRYLTVGKNVGLGFGISSTCAQAYYENNLALIFFDQDTVFQSETLGFIESYHMNHETLDVTYSAVVFNAVRCNISEDAKCFQDVNVAINSGSLFFLKNLKHIGWHNETYFVDGVDYEFCLNSKKHGFKIGKFMCTPGFDHLTEQADKEYRLFGKTAVLRVYPISRILDTIKSSCKLILSALFSFELSFAAMILKFISVYIFVQLISRFLKPVK